MEPEQQMDFIIALKKEAQAKVKEISLLNHELNRLNMEIARTEKYISQLNDFLVSERYESVPVDKENNDANNVINDIPFGRS